MPETFPKFPRIPQKFHRPRGFINAPRLTLRPTPSIRFSDKAQAHQAFRAKTSRVMPVAFSDSVQRTTFWKPIAHDWEKGLPYSQNFYFYDSETDMWKPASAANATPPWQHKKVALEQITILSWNIDFSRLLNYERMLAALVHLHQHILAGNDESPATPHVIMLNEMTEDTLEAIQQQSWIRDGFYVTDISAEFWEGAYGTCMLVPKTLPITNASRIHYTATHLDRDALFVDIVAKSSPATEEIRIIRLCSTHLESLRANPPRRPKQLAEAAKYMRDASSSYGAILGGDLNAIQEFDLTLHTENGLKDAYLETGGVEGVEEGMTWGQTADTRSRKRYGLTRMDKFLYCGAGLKVVKFERFGMDVVVDERDSAEALMKAEGMEKGWVTDHLGIKATFRVGGEITE